MTTYWVTAYPYAVQNGQIEIPDDVNKDDIEGYIEKHFGDIKFGEPSLDYHGTDFDFGKM